MFAGSKRYPLASPIIFTSTVFPVAGAAAAAPAAGAAAGAAAAPAEEEDIAELSVAAGVVVVVLAEDIAADESVLLAFLSPPAHAPRTNTLARSARPINCIRIASSTVPVCIPSSATRGDCEFTCARGESANDRPHAVPFVWLTCARSFDTFPCMHTFAPRHHTHHHGLTGRGVACLRG